MIKYAKYIYDRIPDEHQVWHVLLPKEPGGIPPYDTSFCDGVFYPENIERIHQFERDSTEKGGHP